MVLLYLCHIQDLKVPQRRMCNRFGSQADAAGRKWELKEVGPRGKKLGHWGVALEGTVGPGLPLHSLSFCLLAMKSVTLLSHMLLPWCATSYRPKVTGPTGHGLGRLTLWTKIILFCLQVSHLRHFIKIPESWLPQSCLENEELMLFGDHPVIFPRVLMEHQGSKI